MKFAIVSLLAAFSVSAFAAETNAGRYNCFYKDPNSGYLFGAIAKSEASAKGQAKRDCEDQLNRSDLPGSCSFAGCRMINSDNAAE